MTDVFTVGLVFAGAGIAASMTFVGSAIGMGIAGQAGAGVASEKPQLFGKILVLQVLPGSQGIYGLVVAVLILVTAGVIGGGEGTSVLTLSQGFQYFLSGFPIGFAGLVSAKLQGMVSAAGIAMIAKDESLAGRATTLAVMVETWALFGLLVSVLLVLFAA
ncbi:MAG: V-type ATP synthase subunit K [Candidatus Moranbacteria bacterium]|nr:V-type ATP synthase subunit K [Candidatus Moranbacteria bacterium]